MLDYSLLIQRDSCVIYWFYQGSVNWHQVVVGVQVNIIPDRWQHGALSALDVQHDESN